MTTTTERVASRELDAEVAEKVMGWTPYKNKTGLIEWCLPDKKVPVVGAVVATAHTFRPSQDITAAWEVVEKMRELDLTEVFLETLEGALIELVFYKKANEAAEAICLAALKAVEA